MIIKSKLWFIVFCLIPAAIFLFPSERGKRDGSIFDYDYFDNVTFKGKSLKSQAFFKNHQIGKASIIKEFRLM